MSRFLSDVQIVLHRELDALSHEVDLFPSDDLLWTCPPGITNPAGILVLHGCGNLRHFIGALLAGSGYVRDRPAEFETRGLSRDELKATIAATKADLEKAFKVINESVLETVFPVQVGGVDLNTQSFLMHLCLHLAFHVGQLGYLRRILTGNNETSGSIPVTSLALDS